MADLSVFDTASIVEAAQELDALFDRQGIEYLWGTNITAVAVVLTNPADAVDLAFNGVYASFPSVTGTATWDAMQDTQLPDIALVDAVDVEVRFYCDALLTNDTLELQVYDGATWQSLETFNSGNQPPQAGTTLTYDVTAFLNTLTKLNAAQVQFVVTKSASPDMTTYIDEARVVILKKQEVDVTDDVNVVEAVDLYPEINASVSDPVTVVENVEAKYHAWDVSIFDTVTITEDAPVVLATMYVSVFDTISVVENLQLYLDVLNVSVLDPFHVLITEHVDVIDLVVEVGVVTEIVPVAEFAAVYLTELNVSVYEDVATLDVLDFGTTTAGLLPCDTQTVAWNDGTRNWRAWFDKTNARITFEYADDPDNAWTENVSARISDSGLLNDFCVKGDASTAYISYRTNGDVKVRQTTGYPGTNFSWGSPTTVFTHATKNYEWSCGAKDSNGYCFLVATEVNGAKRYVVVKKSTNPNDLTAWDAAIVIGDTDNENDAFADIGRASEDGKMICLYSQGASLYLKTYDGSWSTATFVDTTKGAPFIGSLHQFEVMYESVDDGNHIVYTKSDGTIIERHYEYGVGLGSAIVIDPNTDCKHPAVGYFYGQSYVAVVWGRDLSRTESKLYYKLERVSDHSYGPITEIATTTTYRMKRLDFCRTELQISGFMVWEELDAVFSKSPGLGVNVSDIIIVTEDVELLIPLHNVVVQEDVAAVEDVTLGLSELFLDLLFDAVGVLEYVDMLDIVVELFTVYDELTVEENLATTVYEDQAEVLWGQTVVSSWDVTDKQNAEDQVFDDQVAVVHADLSNGNVRWSAIQDTEEANSDFLVSASLNVRFRFTAAIISGEVQLILNNGDGETVLETFDSGNYFTALTTKGYDVTAQLDTRKRVNNAVVMLRGFALNSPDIELDEVQILLAKRRPLAFDHVTATENVSVTLPELFAEAYEQVLVTEVAAINDLMIEVGVVAEFVSVLEVFAGQVDHLHMTAFEDVTVLDVIVPDLELTLDVSDSATVIEAATVVMETLPVNVSDTATATENVSLVQDLSLEVSETVTVEEDLQVIVAKGVDVGELVVVDETVTLDVVLIFSVVDTLTVVEDVVLDPLVRPDVYELMSALEDVSVAVIDYFPDVSVFDSVGVADVALLNDLVIELGPAVDIVSVVESSALYLDALFLSVFDDATVTEYAVGHYRIDVADLVAVVENVALTVVDYPDVADLVSIVEDVALLVVDYPDVFDLVTVVEDVQADVVLVVSVFEDLTVTEYVVFHDIIVELFAFDAVAVTEYATVHDIVVELSVFDTVAVAEDLAAYIPDLNVSVYETLTVTESATTFDPVIELFVSESVSTADVVITEGGLDVYDEVGVGGAIIDWVMVDEYLAMVIERLDIDVFDTVALAEYVQMLDIIVELPLVYEQVGVTEASTVDLLIDYFMTEDITVQESLAVYYPIEALFVQDITIVEAPVVVPEYWDLYAIFFKATPRKRMFTVDKRQSGDIEEVEI